MEIALRSFSNDPFAPDPQLIFVLLSPLFVRPATIMQQCQGVKPYLCHLEKLFCVHRIYIFFTPLHRNLLRNFPVHKRHVRTST